MVQCSHCMHDRRQTTLRNFYWHENFIVKTYSCIAIVTRNKYNSQSENCQQENANEVKLNKNAKKQQLTVWMGTVASKQNALNEMSTRMTKCIVSPFSIVVVVVVVSDATNRKSKHRWSYRNCCVVYLFGKLFFYCVVAWNWKSNHSFGNFFPW